jgi:hypothetical protein
MSVYVCESVKQSMPLTVCKQKRLPLRQSFLFKIPGVNLSNILQILPISAHQSSVHYVPQCGDVLQSELTRRL